MIITNKITNKILSGVIHCPDVEINPIWKKITNLKFKNFKPCKNLEIITWNNYINEGIFEKSCKNLNIKIFGKNIKKWNNYLKFKFNIIASKNSKCDYIMGCDSHDAILTCDPEIILEKFLNLNCKLLFNSEVFFFPDLNEINCKKWKIFQNKISKSNFKFLNSGAWIGKKNFVIDFFKDCMHTKIESLYDNEKYKFSNYESKGCDQSIIHSKFEKYYPEIQLNYDADIFLNIANLAEKDVKFNYNLL